MTTDKKNNTKATSNATVDELQQAFDDFKVVYSTVKSFEIKDLLHTACELFVKAYCKNNIGLCKSILLTLTDNDRRQALKYIDFIGLSVSYNIDKDDMTVRAFADFDKDKEVATFADFLKSQRELTKANNKAELVKDLTKYKDKATKQVKRIFDELTSEQKTIFKSVVHNAK